MLGRIENQIDERLASLRIDIAKNVSGEMAAELLSLSQDQELDQFLGKLIKRAGQAAVRQRGGMQSAAYRADLLDDIAIGL